LAPASALDPKAQEDIVDAYGFLQLQELRYRRFPGITDVTIGLRLICRDDDSRISEPPRCTSITDQSVI
jgi:hypothetical protein